MRGNMNTLKELMEEFEQIPIPEELELVVKKAIGKEDKKTRLAKTVKRFLLSAAGVCIVFTATVNISPDIANAMARVPGIGSLVRLVSIRELTYESEHNEVKIEVPQVEGLTDHNLEASLNEKYLQENTRLYEDFMQKINNQELTPANLALFKEYEIPVQTEDFMVIKSVTTEIMASGAESATFDNVDLKNQQIISLPSLFKDGSYINVISNYISSEMKDQMAKGESSYFLAENGDQGGFDKIKANHNFYINADGKLVISFDEYEVAPGYVGMVEFVIPTGVIQDILVSNTYVK